MGEFVKEAPFKSKRQRRMCYYLKSKGENGSWDCGEWQGHTPAKLPETAEKKSAEGPPGYTEAADPSVSCATCKHYEIQNVPDVDDGMSLAKVSLHVLLNTPLEKDAAVGVCAKYTAPVDSGAVCMGWEPRIDIGHSDTFKMGEVKSAGPFGFKMPAPHLIPHVPITPHPTVAAHVPAAPIHPPASAGWNPAGMAEHVSPPLQAPHVPAAPKTQASPAASVQAPAAPPIAPTAPPVTAPPATTPPAAPAMGGFRRFVNEVGGIGATGGHGAANAMISAVTPFSTASHAADYLFGGLPSLRSNPNRSWGQYGVDLAKNSPWLAARGALMPGYAGEYFLRHGLTNATNAVANKNWLGLAKPTGQLAAQWTLGSGALGAALGLPADWNPNADPQHQRSALGQFWQETKAMNPWSTNVPASLGYGALSSAAEGVGNAIEDPERARQHIQLGGERLVDDVRRGGQALGIGYDNAKRQGMSSLSAALGSPGGLAHYKQTQTENTNQLDQRAQELAMRSPKGMQRLLGQAANKQLPQQTRPISPLDNPADGGAVVQPFNPQELGAAQRRLTMVPGQLQALGNKLGTLNPKTPEYEQTSKQLAQIKQQAQGDLARYAQSFRLGTAQADPQATQVGQAHLQEQTKDPQTGEPKPAQSIQQTWHSLTPGAQAAMVLGLGLGSLGMMGFANDYSGLLTLLGVGLGAAGYNNIGLDQLSSKDFWGGLWGRISGPRQGGAGAPGASQPPAIAAMPPDIQARMHASRNLNRFFTPNGGVNTPMVEQLLRSEPAMRQLNTRLSPQERMDLNQVLRGQLQHAGPVEAPYINHALEILQGG